jgi:hypothetical protein
MLPRGTRCSILVGSNRAFLQFCNGPAGISLSEKNDATQQQYFTFYPNIIELNICSSIDAEAVVLMELTRHIKS